MLHYRERTCAAPGFGEFLYRPVEKSPRVRVRNSEANVAPVDDQLFAALKSLRLRIAKQRAVPAYLIFSDRTLLEMASLRPRSREEMAEVNGVGSTKLHEFGDMFLSAIAGHPQVARV